MNADLAVLAVLVAVLGLALQRQITLLRRRVEKLEDDQP